MHTTSTRVGLTLIGLGALLAAVVIGAPAIARAADCSALTYQCPEVAR